jgi:hypothetical protein
MTDHLGQTWFSQHTVQDHLCVAGAEGIVMISTRIRDETSLLLDTTVMTVVECPLLRGEVHMCPGTMMTGARTATSGPLASMRGQSSFRIESTRADIAEMVITERTGDMSLSKMMEIATKYANGE